MRNLIALLAVSLVTVSAGVKASTSAPNPARPVADTSRLASLVASQGAVRPAPAAPAPATATKPKTETEAEADLSVRIAERLAELRAKQQLRAEQEARNRKVQEKKRVDQAAVAAAAAAAEAAKPRTGTHWTYEGEFGPENWSKINSSWSQCATGQRQSPIDLRDGIKVDLEPIAFDYRPSAFTEIDNGHTIQVNLGGGNQMVVGGTTYELQQFHFHRPSEERINGKGTEMVVHLVHRSLDNRFAVLAVLLERGDANPMIQTVWNYLPLEKHTTVRPSVLLNVADILPARRDYFTYMGSFTSPPCTENVLWLVLKQPMTASPQQMALFSRLYPYNARPVQSTNGRLIKESM